MKTHQQKYNTRVLPQIGAFYHGPNEYPWQETKYPYQYYNDFRFGMNHKTRTQRQRSAGPVSGRLGVEQDNRPKADCRSPICLILGPPSLYLLVGCPSLAMLQVCLDYQACLSPVDRPHLHHLKQPYRLSMHTFRKEIVSLGEYELTHHLEVSTHHLLI